MNCIYAAIICVILQLIGSEIYAEKREIFRVKQQKGDIFYWHITNQNWDKIDTLALLPENTIIRISGASKASVENVKNKDTFVIGQPITLRLTHDLFRKVVNNEVFLPRIPEVSKFNGSEPLFHLFDEAFFRVRAVILDLKKLYKKNIQLGSPNKLTAKKGDLSSIELLTPKANRIITVSSLPTKTPVRWYIDQTKLENLSSDTPNRFKIYLWQQGDRPIDFQYETDLQQYSLDIYKAGNYYLQIEDSFQNKSKITAFQIYKQQMPTYSNLKLSRDLDRYLSEVLPRDAHTVYSKNTGSVVFSWRKSRELENARWKIVLENLSEKPSKQEIVVHNNVLQLALKPGIYRWTIYCKPKLGTILKSSSRILSIKSNNLGFSRDTNRALRGLMSQERATVGLHYMDE